MANCKDCIHYDVCESDSEDVALNLTWANKCQHFKDKADVVPKSEVAREIFEEIERTLPNEFPFLGTAVAVYLAELKKKYTESEGKG